MLQDKVESNAGRQSVLVSGLHMHRQGHRFIRKAENLQWLGSTVGCLFCSQWAVTSWNLLAFLAHNLLVIDKKKILPFCIARILGWSKNYRHSLTFSQELVWINACFYFPAVLFDAHFLHLFPSNTQYYNTCKNCEICQLISFMQCCWVA